MRNELKSRPKQLGSLSEPTYLEFIVVAVLAVLSVTAIVVFLDKTASTPPIAESRSVAIQEDAPKPITVAASEEEETVNTTPIAEVSSVAIHEDTPKSINNLPKANNDSVKVQEDAPIATVKMPVNDTDPKDDRLATVDATQGANSSVTISTDSNKPGARDTPSSTITITPPSSPLTTKSAVDANKPTTASPALLKAGDVVTNCIGMKLVCIPAGSFMMGNSRSAAQLAKEYGKEEGRFKNEFPQHTVHISKGFWMGQTEVTQGQYKSVMNVQPWSGKAYVREDANNPAVYVSWDDAVEFCRKLSQQEGYTYRLPTEAEWEYACRAGTTTRFSFGDSDSSLGEYAWFDGNADEVSQDYAHPVRQKKPNLWGMYDMHGNVFEWCSDYYDEEYYSNSPSVDPNGPSSGISRSLRGGSWDNGWNYLRCSYRSDYPVSRGLLVGFRVVRSQLRTVLASDINKGRATNSLDLYIVAEQWINEE